MGIYDRDYYRQGGRGFRLTAPRTAVVAIILINAAVYVAELAGPSAGSGPNGAVAETLAVHVRIDPPGESAAAHRAADAKDAGARNPDWGDTLTRPWLWWQLITYGFVHDPASVQHIIFNMLTLFFLGRDVEHWYGTREFIRLYLVLLAFAALVWIAANRLFPPQFTAFRLPNGGVQAMPLRYVFFGASGAIAGVVVLFALLFPRRTVLFMFVLPLPAWLLGVLAVGYDMYGAMGHLEQRVAYVAHLGGASFALAYFYFHWNVGKVFRPAVAWVRGRGRPPLKVFKPDEPDDDPVTDEEVDRILTKIHREGEGSLTTKERRVMESASREYRRRRRPQ